MLGHDVEDVGEAGPPVGDEVGDDVPPLGDDVGEAVGDDVGDDVGEGAPEEVHPASSTATVSNGRNAPARPGVVPISSSIPGVHRRVCHPQCELRHRFPLTAGTPPSILGGFGPLRVR